MTSNKLHLLSDQVNPFGAPDRASSVPVRCAGHRFKKITSKQFRTNPKDPFEGEAMKGSQLWLACTLMSGMIVIAAYAGDGKISGKVTAKKSKFQENTIVYVAEADGNFNPPAKHPQINQKDLVFVPHVLPVVKGTQVNFLNSDDVLHNVFTPDNCANKFNLGTWPKGEIRSATFDEVGCTPVLLCNVHPEMEAFIVVLQNPFFAVTDADGNFEINNVPAGTYTLKIWNEKLKAGEQKVTVTAGQSTVVNFTLKK